MKSIPECIFISNWNENEKMKQVKEGRLINNNKGTQKVLFLAGVMGLQ